MHSHFMNHLCYSFIRWFESGRRATLPAPINFWDAHQEDENHGYHPLGSVP